MKIPKAYRDKMFTVATTVGLVICLLANVIIPTIDVLSDLNLAFRMWSGIPADAQKRYKMISKCNILR